MTHDPAYVRQKFSIGTGYLRGRGALCMRVVKAWTEIAVLDAEDFGDLQLRADFEWLNSKTQFAVIEGVKPKATDAECQEVARRIEKIHRALGGR